MVLGKNYCSKSYHHQKRRKNEINMEHQKKFATLDGTGVTWYHESMKALGACFRDMNVQYYINYGKGLECITYEEAKEIIVKSWNCTYTYAANALDELNYFDCGSCQIYKNSFNCRNW